MKRIQIFNIVGLLGILLLFNACFFKDPGTEIKFTDIFIEIEQATRQGNANTKDTRQYERVSDGRFTLDSLKINLVAAPQKEDITVTYELAPAGETSGTTAVQGVHFRLLGNSVTIPAGSNFAYIKFEVNDDILPLVPAQFVAIRINLTSTSKGRLSENYKSHRIVLGGRCTFILSKFLGNYLVNEPSYGNYPATLTAGTDPNTVVTDNFWDVGVAVTYTLNPTNDQVTLNPRVFTYGPNTFNVNPGPSPGTLDPCTGNFSIPYVVRLGGTIGSGTVVDNNTHTYIKQ